MKAKYAQRHTNGKHTQAHTVVAEKAIGKPLPKDAEVHHINGDRFDNRPENLVICPDHAYHMLLHKRTEAVEAGFPADYRKCKYCKQFDATINLKFYQAESRGYRGERIMHAKCVAAVVRERSQRKFSVG